MSEMFKLKNILEQNGIHLLRSRLSLPVLKPTSEMVWGAIGFNKSYKIKMNTGSIAEISFPFPLIE
jgi:hypothetical protein